MNFQRFAIRLRAALASRWAKAIQAAVTLLLVGWIVTSIDREVWGSLRSTSLVLLAGCVLIFASAQIFGGLRLFLLTPGLGWRQALLTTWVGYFWGNFLPGSVGGDVVRAFKLNKAGIPLSTAAGALVIDRLCNLISLSVLVAVSTLPLSLRLVTTAELEWLAVILGLAVIAVGLLLFMFRARFVGALARGAAPFLVLIEKPYLVLGALLLSLANVGVSILAQWLIAREMGIPVSYMELAGIAGFITLIVMLPISLNGLGLQEASYIAVLVSMGVPNEKAIAFSLLSRFLILAASIIAGIVLLFDQTTRSSPRAV
ncbi:hypothetical protein FG93_04274 [Bosea sp. LC85]|uniref:lysylphosphatidylglycerol synthase transmembrane domain-containing protein n=1 Tax=Bosea sp. LC85 TaxID=1502851 RepID=UPI0004E2B134|nr:lysylphosphatidylglycerol synthase transmembrane domain-containing protein [Bosea sp. LC85]KFC66794.1 hypothetical protein FG93_04274 [Bosea sp. LC85]